MEVAGDEPVESMTLSTTALKVVVTPAVMGTSMKSIEYSVPCETYTR